MKLEFLKERYDYELQRKEQLTTSLTLPVGVLGGLGSVMALMGRPFTYRDTTLTAIFVPTLVVDILAFVFCMAYLSRAYHRQTYLYLPRLVEPEQWENEFREFNAYVASSAGDVEEAFAGHLRNRIIQAADRNTERNDERAGLLYWSRVALLTVLWLTTLAGFPYVADQVRFFMPTQQAPRATQAQPAPQNAAPQSTQPQPLQNTAPRPPAFPPNREVREGDLSKR